MEEKDVVGQITGNVDAAMGKAHVWLDRLIDFLPSLVAGVIILAIFYFLSRLAHRLSVSLSRRIFSGQNDPKAVGIFTGLLRYGLIFIGIYFAAETLGLGGTISKLMTGVGVMGIIAGVALQGLASSIFSGVLVKMDKSFKVGDFVNVKGVVGKVERIGMITTVIKALDGSKTFVPNQLIFTENFVNITDSGVRRVIVPIGVAYGEDLDRVRNLTLTEVKSFPFVELDAGPVEMDFIDIGPSTYDFEVRFWVKEEVSHREARSIAIVQLKQMYDKENVNLAYPTQTLDIPESIIEQLKK